MNKGAVQVDAGIRVEQVTKEYHLERSRIDVLRGVSLTIQAGEAVSIVGASGAGKSTLLHVIGGLDEPTAGRVFLGNEDIYRAPASRRNEIRGTVFGFVFQSFHLLPELDVLENVMLPALSRRGALRGIEDIRARARGLLTQVGLEARLSHKPLELSGGEQQRAAIARAMMNRPRYILADEPTGNLDSRTGQSIFGILLTMTREEKTGLVMVTHNADLARECPRQMVLRDGILHDHNV